MKERVRAVLVTPNHEVLLIRRERPDTPVYWVLPGGGVEPTDASHEDALRREIHEELAGAVEIHGLIQIVHGADDRQYIYLGRITHWSFPDRSGPEFAEAGRGSYDLDAVPLTADALKAINLKPDAVAELLFATLNDHRDLFTLDRPDERPV
jgi:ADP-ribose pyrophosphatase YjhB (NUDIX family)